MSQFGYFARRYGVWMLIAAGAITAVVAWRAARIEIDNDVARFFRRDDPRLREYNYFATRFGITDVLVVVLRGETMERAEALRERLSASGLFKRVAVTRVASSTRSGAGGAEAVSPVRRGACLVIASPVGRSTDVIFVEKMWRFVRSQLDAMGIEADVVGAPIEVLQASRAVRRDIAFTGTLACLVIVLLLLVSFGDVAVAALSLLPLAAGILWVLGVAEVRLGVVNILSASLPTSLVGIGIDYALHLHAAHRRWRHAEPARAWAHVFRRVGPPLLIGALTTAAAFLALMAARLGAFQEMGWLGALGLAIIFLLSMALLPRLLDWGYRVRLRLRPMPMGWLVRVADWATRNRTVAIAAFLVVTLPLLWLASGMRFENDPTAYEDPSVRAFAVRRRVTSELGLNFNVIWIATRDIRAERAVLGIVREYVLLGDAPASEAPAERKVFKAVECLSTQLERSALGGAAQVGVDWFRASDGTELYMNLYPRDVPYEGDNLRRLTSVLREIRERAGDQIVAISGGPVLVEHALDLAHGDLLRTGAIAAIAVTLISAFLVRRPAVLLAALAPLAGGIAWMLGILRLTGSNFNLANVVAMPLVIGLGIDYGVHIVYRLRRESVHQAMAGAGRAIVASALTTAGGFFCLCAAGNRGLVAMGLASGIGILCCTFWSILFLPALFGQRPAAVGRPASPGEFRR